MSLKDFREEIRAVGFCLFVSGAWVKIAWFKRRRSKCSDAQGFVSVEQHLLIKVMMDTHACIKQYLTFKAQEHTPHHICYWIKID